MSASSMIGYGAWASPITPEMVAGAAVSLNDPWVYEGLLHWLESRPAEGGRVTLLQRRVWPQTDALDEGESAQGKGGEDGGGRTASLGKAGSAGRVESVQQAKSAGKAEGRAALESHGEDEAEVLELTPSPYNVRSRVHEYGGGAYLPTALGVFFVNFSDQNIYLADKEGDIHQITHSPAGIRYADLCHDPRRQRLIAVTEIHGEDGQMPENALAAVALADGAVRLLHRGHDFYASPRLSADAGELLCIAWDHPNMPWDGTLLLRCRLAGAKPLAAASAVDAAKADEAGGAGEGPHRAVPAEAHGVAKDELRSSEQGLAAVDSGAGGAVLRDGDVVDAAIIAGSAQESVMQPSWAPDGAILYISDRSGFWNLWRLDGRGDAPLSPDGRDYGGPAWVFGQRSYVCLNGRRIAASRHADGGQELVLIDMQGAASPLPESAAGCGQLSAYGEDLYYLAARSDSPAACIRLNLASCERTVVAQPPPLPLDGRYLSAPEHIAFPTRDGAEAYAYVYRPRHPDHPNRNGRPPLMVLCHGGPTGAASPALNLLVQFYTSRGWTVVDVDYRGSTGYGRAYRQALNQRWGEIDVADSEDAVRHLAAQGEADLTKVAIRGRSAGGYTTLRALTTSAVFQAGASYYGVADLTALARDTHKFESRYLDSLLGGADALAERSPIHQVENLECPLIFFQGGEDRIVPPNQAQLMVAALRRKRLPVAYLEFPAEGHGFRDGGNIARCIGAEYAFFCRVFHLGQPRDLPKLEIENLD